MTNIDKTILYWIEYFNYDAIDMEELIDYIKDNLIKEKKELIEKYVEAMEIKVPSLKMLNWDYICKNDKDYVKVSEDLYLNIRWLEDSELELHRQKLIK